MKDQLEKKLKKICDDIGTQAAAEKLSILSDEIKQSYDQKTASGMAALDAYRALLRDIEAMEEMLRALPMTKEEKERAYTETERQKRTRKLTSVHDSLQGLWWLLTVVAYFFISFTFGKWHLTWLMFLTSSIGSIILRILFEYNKGVPLKKMTGHFHGILWLFITVVYFLISLTLGKWHLTWLLFILGAIVEMIINTIRKIIE